MDNAPSPPNRFRSVIVAAGVAFLVLALIRWNAGRGRSTNAEPVSVPVSHAPSVGPLPVAEAATDKPASNAQPVAASVETPAVQPASLSRDEQLRQELIGVWTHLDNGQQWIENRPDGTARMFIQLSFLATLLYGGDMHLELQWDIKDGVLSHSITAGTPAENVAKLTKDYGTSRTYKILETSAQSMKLESVSTTPEKEDWTRSTLPAIWASPSNSAAPQP